MFRDVAAVCFDLYGTLIRIRADEEDLTRLWKPLCYFYAYQGAAFDSPEALRTAYRQAVEAEEAAARRRSNRDLVEIRLETVFDSLFRRKGVSPPAALIQTVGQMFRACSTDWAEAYPGAAALLEDLRAAGKGVYLLSNAQRVFTQPELEMTGLLDRFDAIRISSDWGVKKPDPAYFRTLLDRLQLPPHQVLMVGNSARDDIAPARALGLRTCYLNTDAEPVRPACDLALEGADYAALRRALLG